MGEGVEGESERSGPRRPTPAEDSQFRSLPTQEGLLGKSLDSDRQEAGTLFPLKGASRSGGAGLGGGAQLRVSGVRPPAPALVV